jgi:hypothetical protein
MYHPVARFPYALLLLATCRADDTLSSTRNLPVRGKETARVGIVEFSDYKCNDCRERFRATMPWLEEKYIKLGKVRYFVRDFPLGVQAQRWAEATHCATEVGRYWELRTNMFMLEDESLSALLDVSIRSPDRLEVERCLAVARYAPHIQEDIREGRRLGITNTPEFLVGRLDPNHPDELRDVRRLSGNALESAIESMLVQENRLMPEAPVPVVRTADLKRVWTFLSENAKDHQGVDIKLLTGLCDKDVDVLAVWFRATLIDVLLKQRRLDRWREGNGLSTRLFELAASFPLPRGVAYADFNGFIAAIE